MKNKNTLRHKSMYLAMQEQNTPQKISGEVQVT